MFCYVKGDTGSPLFLRTDPSAPWTQIGITSFDGDKSKLYGWIEFPILNFIKRNFCVVKFY